MIRQTIRTYFLLAALTQLGSAFLAATYMMFLLGHGLTYFQANMVNAGFFLAMVFCEIPTGAVADVCGRRVSFLISCALLAAGSLMYAVTSSMTWFVIAEVVCAVGLTCRSGAFQAWAVDQLAHHNYEGSLTHLFSRMVLFERSALILGAIAGPFLFRKAPNLPWIASSATFALCGALALVVMREDYFVRSVRSWRQAVAKIRWVAKSSVRFGIANEPVRFILLVVGGHALAVMAPNMFWQPFFAARLPSMLWTGPLFAVMMVCGAVGALLAPYSAQRIGERRFIVISQIVAGILIALTVIPRSIALCLIVFLLHEVARGGVWPVKDAYLNKHIPSAERATVLSCESIAFDIGAVGGLVASGLLGQNASLPSAWIAAGLLLALWSFAIGWRPLFEKRSVLCPLIRKDRSCQTTLLCSSAAGRSASDPSMLRPTSNDAGAGSTIRISGSS